MLGQVLDLWRRGHLGQAVDAYYQNCVLYASHVHDAQLIDLCWLVSVLVLQDSYVEIFWCSLKLELCGQLVADKHSG